MSDDEKELYLDVTRWLSIPSDSPSRGIADASC